MHWDVFLRVRWFFGVIAACGGIFAQIKDPVAVDGWPVGPTTVAGGVVVLLIVKTIEGWWKVQCVRAERLATAEAIKEARDGRVTELESRLETAKLNEACVRAELALWRRKCVNQPTDREIAAAHKRAREHPDEFLSN